MNNRVAKYRRTKKGLISNIYSCQLKSSRKKEKITISYSLSELSDFIHKDGNFELLFKNWVDSGYDKMKRPSIDRIDNNIGYKLSNIQLMTWEDNNKKARLDIRSGVLKHNSLLNGGHRQVIQYDLDGNIIDEYISVSEASRKLGIRHQSISRVCRGERKKTKGFIFAYKS